jgi:hypothetical protein
MIRRRFHPRYDKHRGCYLLPIRAAPFLVEQLTEWTPAAAFKLEPHPDGDGTFTLIVRSPDDAPAPMIRPGQTVAYHGKLTDLAAKRGISKAEAKREAMLAASMMFGREVTSSQQLSVAEANRLLDWLEEELEGAAAR